MGTISLISAAQGKVTLVKEGHPEAVIILEEEATRSAQLGAFELQHHIKLITGAELPILRGKGASDDKVVIRIGGSNADIQEEASVIKFDAKNILLTGGDSLDYGIVDYQKQQTFPKVNYHWKGSLFAVYDFLEQYCDVHFYGMDQLDTTYQKRATLTVEKKDRYFVSPMDAFRDCYDDFFNTGHVVKKTKRDHDLWKLRWRCSVTFGKVNHNTYSIYFAHWGQAKDQYLAKGFKEKRHEMFAKGYEGKAASCGNFLEGNYPGDIDLPPQLCYSNQATIDYYANEALTYYRGGNVIGGWENIRGQIPTDETLMPRFPGKPYYYPYEGNDSGAFCLCDACQELVKHHPFSQTKFRFIGATATKAASLDPGKPGIATLAYGGSTLPYPDGFVFPEHVSVQLCLVNYSWWHPTIYQKNLENYEKWLAGMKDKGPLTLWLYVYGTQHDAKYHFGDYKPFPLFYPWKMAEQMKRFNSDGIQGIFSECKMPVNFLETYISLKLAYDPSLDAEKLIAKYFTDYYGDAGPLLLQFYREIESTVWDPAFTPKEWLKNPNVVTGPGGRSISPWWGTNLWSRELNWKLGSPERMSKLGELLKKAGDKVKSPEEKERLRRFIEIAWQPAVEGRREYELYLKQREIPPRSMELAVLPSEAEGDPQKINWKQTAMTEKWLDCNGNDCGSSASVRAAIDDKFLYLKFTEARRPWLDQGVWSENVEFFFSADGRYPLYQFAHGPKVGSSPSGRIYLMENDAFRSKEYDFQARTVSLPTEQDWTLYLAFPLARLPLTNNTMSLDFFRMRHNGKVWDVSCWQPTYTISGNKGMDSYGKLFVFPFTVQDDKFKLLWEGSGTGKIKDEAASDGSAAFQTGKLSWYLSYPIPAVFPKEKVRVILRFRLEAEKADHVTCGVYDWKAKKSVFSFKIPASEAIGKEYKEFDIGSAVLTSDMSVYIGSISYQGEVRKNPLDRSFLDAIRFELAEQ